MQFPNPNYTHPKISTSVLRGKAIYEEALRPLGISNHEIASMARSEYMLFERSQLAEPSSLFLLSLKKILLYANPVIDNSKTRVGITLSAQFDTDCLIDNGKQVRASRIITGDKFKLVGFYFPSELLNHLSVSVFECKYDAQYPVGFIQESLQIHDMEGLVAQSKRIIGTKKHATIYMILRDSFEDPALYNNILRSLVFAVISPNTEYVAMSLVADANTYTDPMPFTYPPSMKPLVANDNIKHINAILDEQIDETFPVSYYDTMHSNKHRLLYDEIILHGISSKFSKDYIQTMLYNKSEKSKVLMRIGETIRKELLATRAEKITREAFPFYFSDVDSRGIFRRFQRFDILKLKPAHQNEVNILLKKELEMQEAIINNTCEHLQLVKKIDLSNLSMEELLKAYDDLSSFIGEPNSEHMFKCKNCSFPVICEHEISLYDELRLVSKTAGNDDADALYKARQIIMQRYKQSQTNIDRSDVFGAHCKFCSKILGRDEDAIQIIPKVTASINDSDPLRGVIFMTLKTAITVMINLSTLDMDSRRVIKILYPIIRDEMEPIWQHYQRADMGDDIHDHVRLSVLVLCICSFIALNTLVLKTNKPIILPADQTNLKLNKNDKKTKGDGELEDVDVDVDTNEDTDEDTGSDTDNEPIEGGESKPTYSIKTDFANGFAQIRKNNVFTKLMPGDDKTKAMMLDYYRKVAQAVGTTAPLVILKRSNEYRMMDILNQSPIIAYLRFVEARNNNGIIKDTYSAKLLKVDLSKKLKPETDLFEHTPKMKPSTSKSKISTYVEESFANLYQLITKRNYISNEVSPPLSESILKYEAERQRRAMLNMSNPKNVLPEKTAREVSFVLTVLNKIYCAADTSKKLQMHLWKRTKGKGKDVAFICEYCKVEYSKVSDKANVGILAQLDEDMFKQAMFEFYTNSCPIKDIHLYPEDDSSASAKCIQCGFSKQQLLSLDDSFFKKFVNQFKDYRKQVLKETISNIQTLATVSPPENKQTSKLLKADATDKSTIAEYVRSLSKIYETPSEKIESISADLIDSYIRLVYTRCTYVSNLSFDMIRHPDAIFFDFVRNKFFKGSKPQPVSMPKLKDYDYQDYQYETKLRHLLGLLVELTKHSESIAALGGFLLNKILIQESRRKEFNFAKLKALSAQATIEDMNEGEDAEEIEEDEDGEEGMFMGYDIDLEDMEDNIDGDLD